jgi:arsenic resistance protein ArsH
LVRFTVLMRPHAGQLVDRYSERKSSSGRVLVARDLASVATSA